MPMPTEERVSEIIAALVADRGYDLEGVRITAAGKHSAVRVMVDGDHGVELDAIAALSNDVSELLDDAGDFGEAPYVLEVTTPGIDRPLTLDRHWRRARGRKVVIATEAGEEIEGRVGALVDDVVTIVVRGKPVPTTRELPLAAVTKAVVQIEFAAADPRELELTGLAQGRPAPGAPAHIEAEEHQE